MKLQNQKYPELYFRFQTQTFHKVTDDMSQEGNSGRRKKTTGSFLMS